jgi:hypothetical protein
VELEKELEKVKGELAEAQRLASEMNEYIDRIREITELGKRKEDG